MEGRGAGPALQSFQGAPRGTAGESWTRQLLIERSEWKLRPSRQEQTALDVQPQWRRETSAGAPPVPGGGSCSSVVKATQHDSLNDEASALRNVSGCLFRHVFVCRTRQHLIQLCCVKHLIASVAVCWVSAGSQGASQGW